MKKTFTLVELMIVVGIVSVLAAIALPNFYTMQLRAKRAELPLNVDGIWGALVAHESASGVWWDAQVYTPEVTIGKTARPWTTGVNSYATIGFQPDGNVRGRYVIQPPTIGPICGTNCAPWAGSPDQAACPFGQSDVDAAGGIACYLVRHPDTASAGQALWGSGTDTY